MSQAKAKLKGKGRRQYAALPIRFTDDGHIQVLLLTSRDTRRWVVLKGWPMLKLSRADTAAQEAFEEAGVKGAVTGHGSLGTYAYAKGLKDGRHIDVQVTVFLLVVENELDAWPEQAERERRWYDWQEAAVLVAEPKLAAIIRSSDVTWLTTA